MKIAPCRSRQTVAVADVAAGTGFDTVAAVVGIAAVDKGFAEAVGIAAVDKGFAAVAGIAAVDKGFAAVADRIRPASRNRPVDKGFAVASVGKGGTFVNCAVDKAAAVEAYRRTYPCLSVAYRQGPCPYEGSVADAAVTAVPSAECDSL